MNPITKELLTDTLQMIKDTNMRDWRMGLSSPIYDPDGLIPVQRRLTYEEWTKLIDRSGEEMAEEYLPAQYF